MRRARRDAAAVPRRVSGKSTVLTSIGARTFARCFPRRCFDATGGMRFDAFDVTSIQVDTACGFASLLITRDHSCSYITHVAYLLLIAGDYYR